MRSDIISSPSGTHAFNIGKYICIKYVYINLIKIKLEISIVL